MPEKTYAQLKATADRVVRASNAYAVLRRSRRILNIHALAWRDCLRNDNPPQADTWLGRIKNTLTSVDSQMAILDELLKEAKAAAKKKPKKTVPPLAKHSLEAVQAIHTLAALTKADLDDDWYCWQNDPDYAGPIDLEVTHY